MLIQFPHTSGIINYPDGLEFFEWSKAVSELSIVVAEYTGSQPLTPYAGPWPITRNDTKISTIEWLRKHLGEQVEFVATTSADPTVGAFMKMVDRRINDVLIVSDLAYKTGILALESDLGEAGGMTPGKTDTLLALGGHSR